MQQSELDKLKKSTQQERDQCLAEMTRLRAEAAKWQAKLQECDAGVNAHQVRFAQLNAVLAWLEKQSPDAAPGKPQ